jgi:ubiquinone/menaquinone biosynthesis C-methylase UbiE
MSKQNNKDMKRDKEKLYLNDWWTPYANVIDADETLAIHFGHYEKGVKSHKDAVVNKNNFIGRVLNLDSFEKNSIFLDSGCGVGGTSIYLAKKYPNIRFIGITNSPGQIFLANRFAKEYNVTSNTRFIVGDYLKLGIIDNHFDGIFIVQAFMRSFDKKKFLHEAYRVLKANKKIVIDDVFLKKKPSNFIMRKSYYVYTKIWKIPSIEAIDDIKKELEAEGFKDIKILDITKSFWLSFMILNIKWVIHSFFPKKITKKEKNDVKTKIVFQKGKKSILDNPFLGEIIKFLSPLPLGLSGNLRYMTIVAVKKE